jgi:hypothetical protein
MSKRRKKGHLPYRDAANDLGTKSIRSVQRWYRELAHYGLPPNDANPPACTRRTEAAKPTVLSRVVVLLPAGRLQDDHYHAGGRI